MLNVQEANRQRDLYFVEPDSNRIVLAPKGWADEIGQENEDGEGWEFQCYHGNEDVLAFRERGTDGTGEYLTTDCIEWFLCNNLAKMREPTEAEARQIDPDLFVLLEAIDKQEAF
jgi:hypothetical protein